MLLSLWTRALGESGRRRGDTHWGPPLAPRRRGAYVFPVAASPSHPVPKPVPDPVLEALRTAPLDDEPYTDAERAKVAEARNAPREDDVTTDELRRLLGL